VFSISLATPHWLASVLQAYNNDPKATQLLTKLALHNSSDNSYSLHWGSFVGNGLVGLQLQVLSTLDDSALGGHSRFLVTYGRVKQLFACPGLK
jgi:hypothetical protein